MKKMMLILGVLSLSVISCSEQTAEEMNMMEEDASLTSRMASFDPESLYYSVIKNDDIEDAYSTLSVQEKAALWEYKYEVLINATELNLTTDQKNALVALQAEAYDDVMKNSIDEASLSVIAHDAAAVFNESEFATLFFYLDNPGFDLADDPITTGCFWCNEIISETPCRYDESSGQVVKDFTVKKRRFFIGFGNQTVYNYPCSYEEISDQWDDIF